MAEPGLDLSLVIACYNEAEHLESSVARLLATCDLLNLVYEVIFIDDASSDATRDLLAALPARYQGHRLRVLFNDRNLGRGATVMRGLEQARAPVAGFLDIDLEVDPVYILPFYQRVIAGADAAIGRRIYKLTARSMSRFVLSKGYCLLRRALLGMRFDDTEAGYKFFRMSRARPVLSRCTSSGWFWDTEVVARGLEAGLRIDEVDCLFVRRTDKTSTVRPLRDSWEHLRQLLAFRRARRLAAGKLDSVQVGR